MHGRRVFIFLSTNHLPQSPGVKITQYLWAKGTGDRVKAECQMAEDRGI
jgi:hypothetical protein